MDMQKARKERVTVIINGNTFETARRRCAVRLIGVDGREKNIEHGSKACRDLEALIGGKQVWVEPLMRDRMGRVLAQVALLDGRSVNKEMRKKMVDLQAIHDNLVRLMRKGLPLGRNFRVNRRDIYG